jgi:Exo70 exocyst complex subunit
MDKNFNIKEDLKKKIRECSLSGGEVLRSLDKAVMKLEDFVLIMKPLQDAIEKLGEASSNIDKTLSHVRDLAQLSRESYGLIKEIEAPLDPRVHSKNMERAFNLILYYKKNQEQPDSQILQEKLLKAMNSGYLGCVRLIEEQLSKYNEIYNIKPILQEDPAQVDMIDSIRELVNICKTKAPQYWNSYVKLRSALLCKHLNTPINLYEPYVKGTHYIIKLLSMFIEYCKIEKELLVSILDTHTVQDLIGEVTEAPFQYLVSQTQDFVSKKFHITQTLDILVALHTAIPALEEYLGKSVKYYTASKLYTTMLQKSQSWYREYIQYIQSNKIEFGDFVHDMSIQLAIELKKIQLYPEGILTAKLDQNISHLVTTLIDTYRIKIKSINAKQLGLSQVFMINNLSYWISVLQDLDFAGVEDTMARIEKEMIAEIEEYCKSAWSKLIPILSDTPTVIEFKKAGILTRSSRKAVKNKFKSFNNCFSEVFNFHKTFSIYSKDIMQLLRRKNYNMIVAEYKEFLKRYLAVDFTTRREKYLLYPVELVEQGILNMYSQKNIPAS